MKKKLIMCEEISTDGNPLPLASLFKNQLLDAQLKLVWEETVEQIITALSSYVPEVEILMPRLWEVERAKARIIDGFQGATVSLTSYNLSQVLKLQLSRHFSPGGADYIGIGKRPGSQDLSEQVALLRAQTDGRSLIISEDDIFTGGTAKEVIAVLHAAHFTVAVFVAGFQVSDIDEISGVPIIATQRFKKNEILDIVDPRDVIFGLPQAGLVISDGPQLYRAPWVLPWVDLMARASVPAQNAKALSNTLATINKRFFAKLGKQRGQAIYVSDMAPEFHDFIKMNTQFNGATEMVTFCEFVQRLNTGQKTNLLK